MVADMPPTYMDRYRFAFSDFPAPIFCAWFLIQGLTGGGPLPILFGLAGVVFTLFKRHKSYDLYEDALIVRYLLPTRVAAIYLRDIEGVQVVRQPMVGAVVLIHRKNEGSSRLGFKDGGSRLIIRPRDSQEMLLRLNAMLQTQAIS